MLAALLFSGVLVAGCGNKNTEGGTANDTYGSGAAREVPTAEGNKQEGDTIKIGHIASLNGEQQPWGIDSQRGAELAVEEFNKAGGKDGMKVQIIHEDTGSKPEGGKSATEKLIGDDRVIAVIGEVASGITLPAAQVCQENGVPMVAVGATRIDVTEIGAAIFRACYTDDFQGAAMAKYAYEDLGLRNVAILTDKKLPYSTGLSDVFRNVFQKLGGKIATEEFYEAGNIDFKGQLNAMKGKNPDGIFASGYFTEVGPIARQKKSLGMDIPMFGGDGWDSRDLLTSGGDGIIGGYFANHYHASEDRPEVKRFVESFRAKYGQDAGTAMAALAYDATNVVLEAIKKADTLDSKTLMRLIAETKDLQAVSGSITIGPDGNAQKPILVLKVDKDGFKPVKKIEFFTMKD